MSNKFWFPDKNHADNPPRWWDATLWWIRFACFCVFVAAFVALVTNYKGGEYTIELMVGAALVFIVSFVLASNSNEEM